MPGDYAKDCLDKCSFEVDDPWLKAVELLVQPMGDVMGVANQTVEVALRSCLEEDGYHLSALRRHGETGVDILASKLDEQIFVEVIGFKDSPPARSRDFYEVFFRAISRLNERAARVAIALPERFALGLHQRAAIYGPAWGRLGAAFPELEVWLVNHQPPSYRQTTWNDWLMPKEANVDEVWAALSSLKRDGNHSWRQLRRGCQDLLGEAARHSTSNVAATARSFARRVVQRTGMTCHQLLGWLDQHELGKE